MHTPIALRPGICLLATCLLSASFHVSAQDYGDCTDLLLPERGGISTARVASSAARTYFVKDHQDDASCPAASPACTRKAYVVPGDPLIISGTRAEFSCAHFIGKGAKISSGWLPTAALAAEATPAYGAEEWSGNWSAVDATIVIKTLSGGRLAINGDASWGSHDPERVERGGVNVGSFEPTEVSLDGPLLAFEPDAGNIDPDEADSFTCVVQMQRLGALLLVRDNLRCGGMNVSFTGVYRR